jgi:hypothetical protein
MKIVRRIRLWRVLPPHFARPSLVRFLFMALDIAKLTAEFQTFLEKDNEARIAESAANVAGTELDSVTTTESAAVATRQAEADQAIATSQAKYDTAAQAATSARVLAERQKYHVGGLLGITPPTDDPTE